MKERGISKQMSDSLYLVETTLVGSGQNYRNGPLEAGLGAQAFVIMRLAGGGGGAT